MPAEKERTARPFHDAFLRADRAAFVRVDDAALGGRAVARAVRSVVECLLMGRSMAETVGHAKGLPARAARRMSAAWCASTCAVATSLQDLSVAKSGQRRGNPVRTSTRRRA